jgi:hypothetical protein
MTAMPPRFPSTRPADPEAGWRGLRIAVPRGQIGYLCALLEAHDNAAIPRTDDADLGHMTIVFPAAQEALVRSTLAALGDEMPVHIAGEFDGLEPFRRGLPA